MTNSKFDKKNSVIRFFDFPPRHPIGFSSAAIYGPEEFHSTANFSIQFAQASLIIPIDPLAYSTTLFVIKSACASCLVELVLVFPHGHFSP